MSATPPRDLDETGRLGEELYATRIRPKLKTEDVGKFVAIDVNTGDFELDADDYTAVTRLRDRQPDADIWLERAGYPAAYKFGGSSIKLIDAPDAGPLPSRGKIG